MQTRPCKWQAENYNELKRLIDEYFSERKESQEVRELKNGDKRVYRTPPSKYGLCQKLGIDTDTFDRYTDADYTEGRESYNKEICGLLVDARERIINELYEGALLGYWDSRITAAQLVKFGIIGSDSEVHEVKVTIQGDKSWSE